MASRTYSVPQDARDSITKMINKLTKKAVAYGVDLTVTYGDPYVKEIPVYDTDSETGITYQVGKHYVECFDLTIDGDDIKKGDYKVAAKIEHLEGGNLVNVFEGEENEAWRTTNCTCEHCQNNRVRKVTYIVRDASGAEKQVGSTCLKDYCGIDPHAVGIRNEIESILLNEDVYHRDYERHPVADLYETVTALATAVIVLREQGYIKSEFDDSNKNVIYKRITKDLTDEQLEEGRKLAEGIMTIEDSMLANVQTLIQNKYCKSTHLGYIAYAPVAYEKALAKIKEQEEREAAKAKERQSEFVGQIGQRITIEVATLKLLTSWETQFGMTHLYKVTDTNGNVFVWFASQILTRRNSDGDLETLDADDVHYLKATVKDHSEREGVKQTVITRAKVA